MKTLRTFTFAVLFWAAAALAGQAQNLTLGTAAFAANSDQGTPDCYEPLSIGMVNVYEGFGKNQGNTRSEAYAAGGIVAGVKTVKRQVVERTAAGTLVEDWWLAYDTQDNLRVLKLTRAGALLFQATPGQTPPVFLPANPAKNDTWTLFGQTHLVEYPLHADRTALLKLKITWGAKVQWVQYHCGVGRTITDLGQGSGWNLKAL